MTQPDSDTPPRFYTELAPLWPLISPPEEYEEDAAFATETLRSAEGPVRDVLELGSGGGHNAYHLRAHFTLTLVDLSEDMLDVSRQLNPACEHIAADMRDVRLDRTFDGVFVHDAIGYMRTRDDLRKAIRTAYLHTRPGGVALFMPDDVREHFVSGTECGGTDAADGSGVRYLAWSWAPTERGSSVHTSYNFTLRSADGQISTLHETHVTNRFSIDEWWTLLSEEGFSPESVRETTTELHTPRTYFVGRRAR